MKKPERIVLNEEEVDSLLERLSANQLADSDKKIIAGIIQVYQQIQFALQEAKISVTRLRNLFGFRKTEKRSHLSPSAESCEEQAGEEGSETNNQLGKILGQTLKSLKQVKNALKEGKKKGHGRLSHKDYWGADVVKQPHESLKAGDNYPEGCGGHLYSIDPRSMVCLTGHALASATKYLQERYRCALCGKVFTAKPKEGDHLQKYDEALKANLAIAKNYAGVPFYRLEMLQKMVGMPLPHSTQWQLVESLANDVYPVYYEMERLAAQGQIISHDDRRVRVLSLIEENKAKAARGEKGRTGMYTTGVVSQVGQYIIYLFL